MQRGDPQQNHREPAKDSQTASLLRVPTPPALHHPRPRPIQPPPQHPRVDKQNDPRHEADREALGLERERPPGVDVVAVVPDLDDLPVLEAEHVDDRQVAAAHHGAPQQGRRLHAGQPSLHPAQ